MSLQLKEQWKQIENWLLSDPYSAPRSVISQVRIFVRILYAVIRDLINGPLSLHAMSLVYTTMLSIVPMLALSFSVLKAFNVQDRFTPMLYGFLEPMGEKGIEIHNSVLNFVANIKVGVLGFVGFILLFYTVISLVQKIERAFNSIWYAPQLRSVGQRFTNYLSVILVGPVVVVTAISVTASTMNSSLVTSLMAIEPFGTLIVTLTKLMPFIMIIAAFTFFYMLMPNTKVNFSSALLGGVVSGASWQATSLMFTSFVVGSTNYDAIYSGFAVGIILLIWLYVNWLILLLGSSIAFYHQHGNHITRQISVDAAPELMEKVGLDIMAHVAKRYEAGYQPISQDEIERLHFIPAVLTRTIVDKLIGHHLLLLVGEKSDCLAPGRSTDQISVAEIYRALRTDDCDLMSQVSALPEVSELTRSVVQDNLVRLERISLRDLITQAHH